MYFIFVISVSVIIACLAWMAASDVLALNKVEITAEVILPDEIFSMENVDVTDEDGITTTKTVRTADISKVSQILKDAGIIESRMLFEIYSSLCNAKENIDPGSYNLSTIYDYRAIVKKMQFGSDSQVRTMVTFPEGFTMEDIFMRLEENKICEFEDLMKCAEETNFSYRYLDNIPVGEATRLEGFLFPDTYEFYQGMSAEAAIDTFLQIFHYKLTAEMWEIAEAKGLTMRDVVTIASLIEKEAANDDERKIIASVIFNRLNSDMYLGIDAVLNYALKDDDGIFTQEQLNTDSPYNSRLYKGLPPTPICSPGFSSIMAVLKYEPTDYYYYALDEAAGTHKFFTNINDFNAFVATQNYND